MLGILQSAGGRISRRLGNRGSLTSKRGNQDYYKGKGGRKEGHHTKHGGYVMVPKKMLEIVAPDLTACELKPYVAANTPLAPKE